jgi:hypothetical protein
MTMTRDHEPSDRDLSELAALADGLLSPKRAERLEQRVASSPQLAAALDVQRRAVRAARTVRSLDDPAPERLRARVERERTRHARAAPRRLLRVAAGGVAAACACVALALVVLPSGSGDPTVFEAAALGQRPASSSTPARLPGRPGLLDRKAEGLDFPDWEAKFRWRATGARRDELDGRRATTVFYENPRAARIAYTILSGPAIDPPDGARVAVREGTELRVVERGGRRVVTWLRGGHTCVLSGDAAVKPAVMLELAGWRAKGAITF